MRTPLRKLEANRRYRLRNRDAVLYHKRNARLRRFGLEPEDLTRMLEEQNHRCFICGEGPLFREGRKRLSSHIDHCHFCGAVRKILCKRCNTAIGFIESNEDVFFKVMAYYVDHFTDSRFAHPKKEFAQ